MSFLIVNTGRAASRAFYINLRAQPGLITSSRTQFDNLISYHNILKYSGKFRSYANVLRCTKEGCSPQIPLGIVFHGARPRLYYPYNNGQNDRLLEKIRDELDIKNVFLVIRESEKCFLSEINRRIAKTLGDWSFKPEFMGWKAQFGLQDLKNLQGNDFRSTVDVQKSSLNESLIYTIAKKAVVRTGKTFSIYQLFNKIFPNVYLIQYEKFLDNPNKIFKQIGKINSFDFDDSSLCDTKLNSLANRLLIYNPIIFSFDDVRNITSKLRNKFYKFTGWNYGRLRLRLEISKVIELCEDWGSYISLGIDCSPFLPRIVDDLKTQIGIGAKVVDLHGLSTSERALIRNRGFIQDLIGRLAPVFQENYKYTKMLYKKNSLNYLPADVKKIFLEENNQEIEKLDKIIAKRKDLLL